MNVTARVVLFWLVCFDFGALLAAVLSMPLLLLLMVLGVVAGWVIGLVWFAGAIERDEAERHGSPTYALGSDDE